MRPISRSYFLVITMVSISDLKDWWDTDCQKCLNTRKVVAWIGIGGVFLFVIGSLVQEQTTFVQLIALSGWAVFFGERVHRFASRKTSVVFVNKHDPEYFDQKEFNSLEASQAFDYYRDGIHVLSTEDGEVKEASVRMPTGMGTGVTTGCKECDEHKTLIQTLIGKHGVKEVEVDLESQDDPILAALIAEGKDKVH